MKRPTLRRRLYTLLLRAFVLFVIIFALVSFFSFSRFRKNALEEKMLLARTVAHYLDSTTAAAIQDLGRLASQLRTVDAGAVGQMRSFRFQSLFRDAIYILDDKGEQIVSDPAFAKPLPRRQLPSHEAVTPLFYKADAMTRPALAMIQPFRRGSRRYFLVSEMNPLGSIMSTFLQNLATEPELHVVVVDANGVVIAAPDQKQLFHIMSEPRVIGVRITAHRPFVSENADCFVCGDTRGRQGFLTVMAPLRFAPWGVVVQEHESKVFATLYASQSGFLAAGALLVVMGLFLSRALLNSVISPIQELSRRAELLRRGDLSTPIAVAGDYEIEVLAATMEGARNKLASTLGELRALNENLEGEVAARTKVLTAQYENLRLLHDVARIATQDAEPERLLPEILRLVSQHHSIDAVALVTTPADSPAAVYSFPAQRRLPWLDKDAQPPAGWQKWDLVYRGKSQGQLFCLRVANRDEDFMRALQQQLAMLLQGTYLRKQMLAQDAQRRILVRRLLEASEEERRRIARELHDEISQLLTVIQLSLDNVSVDAAEMKKAKDLLARTQKEIHRIIYDLRPSLLDDLGLPAAIKWYATNYLAAQGIQVSLEVEDDLTLSAELQIATFRIYQEIITNILRHSQAENVAVELYATGEHLVLAVEDDGIGFSPADRVAGAGIVGMRERAGLVNGSITFDSTPGSGTQVVLKVPVK